MCLRKTFETKSYFYTKSVGCSALTLPSVLIHTRDLKFVNLSYYENNFLFVVLRTCIDGE